MNMRAQSAMEYLTTYGWAIVVIAVVVVALASIGVFYPLGLGPKATAGSCQVQRPYGAGTVQFINLIGTCNGELPQFVTYFDGNSVTANALASSSLTTPFSSNAVSVIAWAKAYGGSVSGPIVMFGTTGSSFCDAAGLRASATSAVGEVQQLNAGAATVTNSVALQKNTWYQLAFTYASNSIGTLYINGQNAGTASNALLTTDTPSQIYNIVIGSNKGTASSGASSCGTLAYFNGTISNIQVYNTALSANDISALYQEGIGGAPIDLQHIQAWYQMNQNVFDYSGNLNNMTATNAIYLSNWQTGYSTP